MIIKDQAMTEEQVVLVDEQGQYQGLKEKMQAHLDGDLHLAFSVLLYRDTELGREYLLQQREMNKYHSGGLWTNTCCSHPRLNETIEQAGIRRLQEEMGIVADFELTDIGHFCYRAQLDNELVEHELDHILVASTPNVVVNPNPQEVMAYRWWSEAEIKQGMSLPTPLFTAWFSDVFTAVKQYR